MPPFRLLPALFLAVGLTSAGCARDAGSAPGDAPAARVHAAYLAGLDSLAAAADGLARAAEALDSSSASAARIQTAFHEARAAYKRVEHLVELTAPTAAGQINGPPIDEVEEDDPDRRVIPAEGFQVLEEMLFPGVQASEAQAIRDEAAILRGNVERVRQIARAAELSDAAVFDALRLQIARLVTLGIAGFDSPVALRSVPETAESFRALRAAFASYRDRLEREDADAWREADSALAGAAAYLDANADFDRFDRMTFITVHANPAARALLKAQRTMGIGFAPERRALDPRAATVFDRGAYDPYGFAAPDVPKAGAEQAALGRLLFFDPVLSGDGTRACASCHLPERAFTDGRARSLPLRAGSRVVIRNAPTVINAGLQAGSFYDLRTSFLEDQVADVVRNPDEMHGDFARAVARLRESPEYAAHFARAFGGGNPHRGSKGGDASADATDGSDAVTEENVRRAVAAYVRSLQRLDSRWDRAARGEPGASLSAEETAGFNLFMGKAKCGTCHFAPLFNGTVPPAYVRAEVEVLGVPSAPVTRGAVVDPDVGRYAVHGIALHRHAFKTPTVRNVEPTAPYMHNGVYRTLEEVVDFYDRGGGAGIGIDLPNQTLPPDPLNLSDAEKRALVAFMRALTDTASLGGRPAALPRFPRSPELNARPIGGAY